MDNLDSLKDGIAAQAAVPLALTDLLIEKGIISREEFVDAYDRRRAELRDATGL